jgi:transcriptional regulator GlxA family with amidase domain
MGHRASTSFLSHEQFGRLPSAARSNRWENIAMLRQALLTRSVHCFVAPTVLLLFISGAVFAADATKTKADTNPAASPKDNTLTNADKNTRTLGIVLYSGFELLDVYGPAEMFGCLGGRMKVLMVAQKKGPVASTQGPTTLADHDFDDCPPLDLILVPGGFGTMRELGNETLLDWLRERAKSAEIISSVCTGSAILAKAGLLDGRRATSNKQYFSFAVAQGPNVKWVDKARWVDDGDRVTSSGVSAGMDMALHIIQRLYGAQTAERIANATEYQWQRDPENDPFAKFLK